MTNPGRPTPADHARMNAAAWDEIALERRQWLDARGLDTAFFRAGGSALSALEREALGELQGKRVLHLQCATGEDTLSLANLGADVTGLDISVKEIAEARAKAADAGVPATFAVADVQALPGSYRDGRFDLVYTGIGAVTWLDDLDGWAAGIADALPPGGRFVLYDQHPMEYAFEEIDGRLVVVHSYFETEPEYESGWSHFPTDTGTATKAEFNWTVGGVVTALGRHGVPTLRLEELADGERLDFQRFPGLVDGDRGKIPGGLLLVAVRLPDQDRSRP